MSSDVISSWQFHQPKSMVIMVIMVISQRLPPFNWSSTWVELGYQMIQMLPPPSAEEGTVLPKWNSLRFRTSTEHGTSKEEGRNSFWMWTCLERRETRSSQNVQVTICVFVNSIAILVNQKQAFNLLASRVNFLSCNTSPSNPPPGAYRFDQLTSPSWCTGPASFSACNGVKHQITSSCIRKSFPKFSWMPSPHKCVYLNLWVPKLMLNYNLIHQTSQSRLYHGIQKFPTNPEISIYIYVYI